MPITDYHHLFLKLSMRLIVRLCFHMIDTVNHNLLLAKLFENFGFADNALKMVFNVS